MVTIRELVTRLSFKFDRTNLDKFENAIVGFKTKFLISAGLIGGAFNKLINFADEFSDSLLHSEALAKFSRLSVQQLKGLENAFAKFNIPKETFNKFSASLAQGITEAAAGVPNAILELVQQSRGAVRLEVEGQITDIKTFIGDLIEYIRSIPSEAAQIRILGNLGFNLTEANAFIELSKQGKQAFLDLVAQEEKSFQNIQKNIDEARKFKQEINNLTVEWNKFTDSIKAFSVPILSQTIGGLNDIIEGRKEFAGGAQGVVKSFGNAALNTIQEGDQTGLFGAIGLLPKFLRGWLDYADKEAKDYFDRTANSNTTNNSPTLINNNRIEISVPPGTAEDQADFQFYNLKRFFEDLWNEKIREVVSNNPQYE